MTGTETSSNTKESRKRRLFYLFFYLFDMPVSCSGLDFQVFVSQDIDTYMHNYPICMCKFLLFAVPLHLPLYAFNFCIC